MTGLREKSEQGRIPFRLRIGVTGVRRLDNGKALAGQVRQAIERIRELAPSSAFTRVLFSVVSPLAEGADRLVAREVLRHERADLEVPLPFPQEEYLREFESDVSKREFDELLGHARDVMLLPSSDSRDEAYERVGRYVADRCDILIALWNGELSLGRGGTAEIVDYAEERGVPIIQICTEGQHEIVERLGSRQSKERLGRLRESFRRLDELNRGKIAREPFEREVDQQASALSAMAQRSGAPALRVQALSAWVTPFYARADLLAMRYQPWYFVLGNALFLLAAAAVAAVASQALFAPERPELVWIEVGLILGVLAIVGVGRGWRFHERWISYRFLAERFRSALFLALAGLSGRREGGLERVYLGHPSEEWLRRAFGEVWSRREQSQARESSVEGLRRFLVDAWIASQIGYHRRMSKKHHRRHQRLTWASLALFSATALAALLHALDVGGDGSSRQLSWANLLVVLAISLPTLGAALSGIRGQREYLRHSERSSRIVDYLESAKMRMEAAPDIPTIQEIAAEAEDLMLEENRDWFVVMKFHDFEVHM